MNRIEYTIYFKDPPMMTVKEEYLIYDYVGFISSVGGILGICVGISFYGISENLVGLVTIGISWYQKRSNGGENAMVKKKTYKSQKRRSKKMSNMINLKTTM